MTTQYEHSVAALAEASGADIAIGDDRVATMSVEGRIVLMKPSDDAESGLTAFSMVANADGGSFEKGVLEKALSMDLFGAQTDKGHVGLFGDSLFFSMDIALEGVTSEALAERLLAFSRLAADIESQLDGEGRSEASPEPTPLPGGFGMGGLMV